MFYALGEEELVRIFAIDFELDGVITIHRFDNFEGFSAKAKTIKFRVKGRPPNRIISLDYVIFMNQMSYLVRIYLTDINKSC